MSIRWITPQLGTGPALQVLQEPGVNIIDVRELVDKAGNRSDAVLQKITEGCESLRAGKKTVVCCDYGISRSNSIAVGILAVYEGISFEAAVRRVLDATGEKEIKVDPLQAVRRALGGGGERRQSLKRRVLVTGASGALGQSLCPKLAEDFEVIAPGRSQIDLQLGATQLDLLAGESEAECIVHLANPRIFTSNVALGQSLTMLRNVIDVCVVRGIRLVYLSSWEVYSSYKAGFLLADESTPLFPKGPFGETKFLSEALIDHSRKTQGLKCTVLRLGHVYGFNESRPKFIYNFIKKIMSREKISTHMYDNGPPALDLIYVDDVISIILKSINSEFDGNLNIGTGSLCTTKRISEILMDLIGDSVPADVKLIDSYTAGIAMDARKAYTVFGWKPTVSVEQGLKNILTRLSVS